MVSLLQVHDWGIEKAHNLCRKGLVKIKHRPEAEH